MNTIIPVGYRLSIDSWENDGDYNRTETIAGLDREAVLFYIDICASLRSKNSHDDMVNFGNMYAPGDDEIEAFNVRMKSILAKHNRPELEDYDDYGIENILDDMGLLGAEVFTRVFSSLKVELIKEPIELEDVTALFSKDLGQRFVDVL